MDYEKIFRVESISQRNIEKVNKLLDGGWVLLGVDQRADLSAEGIPESHVFMLLGATKEVYQKLTPEDVSPRSNNPIHF